MNKTIFLVIGVIFAMIFMGLILRLTFEQTQDEQNQFLDVQRQVQGNALKIAWETDQETDATVVYYTSEKPKFKREYEFTRIHSIEIKELSGNVTYFVRSCDVIGKCISTKNTSIMIG